MIWGAIKWTGIIIGSLVGLVAAVILLFSVTDWSSSHPDAWYDTLALMVGGAGVGVLLEIKKVLERISSQLASQRPAPYPEYED